MSWVKIFGKKSYKFIETGKNAFKIAIKIHTYPNVLVLEIEVIVLNTLEVDFQWKQRILLLIYGEVSGVLQFSPKKTLSCE